MPDAQVMCDMLESCTGLRRALSQCKSACSKKVLNAQIQLCTMMDSLCHEALCIHLPSDADNPAPTAVIICLHVLILPRLLDRQVYLSRLLATDAEQHCSD